MAASLEKHPNSNANKKELPLPVRAVTCWGRRTDTRLRFSRNAYNEDLKGNKSLGCGTAHKLWPRSLITEIQGLVGTPLSTPPWESSTGVPKGSTTESQGMEWMSTGARVSNWNRMLYNLTPLNPRPGHTHTHTHTCAQDKGHDMNLKSWIT